MNAEPARVFVVDDDARVRAALSRLIRAAGYAVEAFGSAREFLARPAHEGPACLVLDLRMPELGGLELQEALGDAPGTMPVIFLTGHADVRSSVRAMKGGAVDFLLKPVEDVGCSSPSPAPSGATPPRARRRPRTARRAPGGTASLRASARYALWWPGECSTSRSPASSAPWRRRSRCTARG